MLSSHDAMGRVTQNTDGVGNVTGTTFDGVGNPTVRTDAGSGKVTMVYDDVDRMTVEIDQRGKSVSTFSTRWVMSRRGSTGMGYKATTSMTS